MSGASGPDSFSAREQVPNGAAVDEDDDRERGWRARARGATAYVIGVLGLIAWFALLYFMLRDVS